MCDVTYYYVALNQLYTHTQRVKSSRWPLYCSLFVRYYARTVPLRADPVPRTHFHAHFPFSHAVIFFTINTNHVLTRKESLRKGALMRQTCCGIWRKSLWLFSIP